LVIYDASHPSTLNTNLGPSLAQWTPFMAIRGGATTSETKKNKYNKPNVRINIISEGYFYTMKVLQL
jgi:hypothetical protein